MKGHNIGDEYTMDGQSGWKVAYYYVTHNGETGEKYAEQRVLVERPAVFNGKEGIDFREVPERYLTKHTRQ